MFNAAALPLGRIALGVGALAVVIGALWAYGNARESAGAGAEREKARAAAAAEYKQRTDRVLHIGEQLSAAVAAANTLEPKVLERYKYVTKQVPLPADCRVDPQRMRSLSDAVGAANAVGGLGR